MAASRSRAASQAGRMETSVIGMQYAHKLPTVQSSRIRYSESGYFDLVSVSGYRGMRQFFCRAKWDIGGSGIFKAELADVLFQPPRTLAY